MNRHYFIRLNKSFIRVDLKEVFYIQSTAHHCQIFTVTGVLTPHISLKQLEEELPTDLHCRINRSVIIFMDKIDRFDRETVYLKNNASFSFSEAYRQNFLDKVTIMIHREIRKGGG